MLRIRNESARDGVVLERMARDTLDAFHARFPGTGPVEPVELVFCNDENQMFRERWKYLGYRDEPQYGFNGLFTSPPSKRDTLLITIVVKEDEVEGIRSFYEEKDAGTGMEAVLALTGEELEKRGIHLMTGCKFVETLAHEYSHACCFSRMMQETGWKNPEMGEKDVNYGLHDELIARYRGMMVMFDVIHPLAEPALNFSLVLNYTNDTVKKWAEHIDRFRKETDQQKANLNLAMVDYRRMRRISDEEAICELEEEFGHPLHKRVWPLELTDVEIYEYLAVDEFAPLFEGALFLARNPLACYEGAQYAGCVLSSYEMISDLTGAEAPDRYPPEKLDIVKAIKVPFWKTLSYRKIKELYDRCYGLIEENMPG